MIQSGQVTKVGRKPRAQYKTTTPEQKIEIFETVEGGRMTKK